MKPGLTRATIRVRCNLCKNLFRASSLYQRFCRSCKTGDELFRFSEWMMA